MAKSNKKINEETAEVIKETIIKKKKGCLAGVILFAILIAVLLFLMKHFHFGFFDGDDDGKGKGNNTSASDTVSDREIKETVVDVRVMGSEYVFEDDKIVLSELIDEINKKDSAINVHIMDDNAYQDTMQDLIDELEKAGIAYTAPTIE